MVVKAIVYAIAIYILYTAFRGEFKIRIFYGQCVIVDVGFEGSKAVKQKKSHLILYI